MTAAELVRAGKLEEARKSLIEQVKLSPEDQPARALLFQVLAFQGEWDKAVRHLEVLTLQAPQHASFYGCCRDLIAAEKARDEVAQGTRLPEFLTDPPRFLQEFLAARREVVRGEGAKFTDLCERLSAELAPVTGVADGVDFDGFCNCDDALSWFLEVYIHDRYLWFPFSSLRELRIIPPVTLLDLLWVPASLVTRDGMTADCRLPVLYHGSTTHGDDQARLGRITGWLEMEGYSRGIGQQLFQVGGEEKGLLEIREVTFNYHHNTEGAP